MASVYLELVDPATNTSKFWEAESVGASVTIRWGRIGTRGQSQVKSFASERAAEAFLGEKAAEKRRKGYEHANAPSGATSSPPFRTRPDYLAWEISEPLAAARLAAAATRVDEALMAAGRPGGMGAAIDSDEVGVRVRLYADGEHVEFGFPPAAWLASLPARDRKLVEAQGGNGWLSAAGTGSGTLYTNLGLVDLPVRLLLTELLVVGSALTVVDSAGTTLQKRLVLPRHPEHYAWWPLWTGPVQSVLGRYWLMPGEAAMVSFEATEYAW